MAKRRRKKGARARPVVAPKVVAPKKKEPRSRRVWVGIAVMAVGVAVVAWGLRGRGGESVVEAERLRVRVVARYPHQTDAFTQGLVWKDGVLYESTGGTGESSLREVVLATGEVVRMLNDEPALFAEGLALVGDRLFQLTWRDGRALVYGAGDFAPVREHRYEGEGWGLCHDGKELVMSDGSDRLAFRDPETFEVKRTVRVTLEGNPVMRLNELECVGGAVWANIWQEDRIVRVDADGRVTAVVDASGLLTAEERRGADVLNGIAWMPERGHFLLTGKRWPWMFEVDLEPEVRRRAGGR